MSLEQQINKAISLEKKGEILKAKDIYKSILKLREACPRHAYIQYTGTPTGIMLESTFNHLSPDFAENINPGENYVGIE